MDSWPGPSPKIVFLQKSTWLWLKFNVLNLTNDHCGVSHQMSTSTRCSLNFLFPHSKFRYGGREGEGKLLNHKDPHTMTTNRIPNHGEHFVQISYLTIFVESSPVFADSKPLFMVCKSCEAYFLSPELVINAKWKCFMINQVGPRYVSDPSKNYLEEFLWAIQCSMHIVHSPSGY